MNSFLKIQQRYHKSIKAQQRMIKDVKRDEELIIPQNIDYTS